MLTDILGVIAQLLTAFGVSIAVYQLKADHDKSRREFAARLVWDWTLNNRRNSKITTKLIDQLSMAECNAIFNQNPFKLDSNYEQLLLAVISGTEFAITKNGNDIVVDIALSSHLKSIVTHYLNLLESVFTAWYHQVGDKAIIEQQFRYLVNPEGEKIFLKNYLETAGGSKNYPMLSEFIIHIQKRYFPRGEIRNKSA